MNLDFNDATVQTLAEQGLLQVDDVNLWITHKKVQQNRKEGAAKAAKKTCLESRKVVQEHDVCQAIYEKETQMWIGCEECDAWFHRTCAGITFEPHTYTCTKCASRVFFYT